MALFGNRAAPKYIRLGVVPVPFVYLGDDLVYDGTTPAIVPLPRATATATTPVPVIGAGAAFTLPTATAVSEARVPTTTAGGAVAPLPAAATATAAEPQITAGVSVTLPFATALAAAPLPETQVVASGEILLPRAEASATALTPTMSAVAIVTPPAATAVSEALTPTITASGEPAPPAATATADALLPIITAGAALTLPTATASAMGRVPVASVPGAITLPTATATATALAPTAATFLPSKMTKNGSYTLTTSYAQVTGWSADTAGYPGSVVNSNRLNVQSTGTGVLVEAALVVTSSGTSFDRTASIRLVRTGGTVIATGPTTTIPGNSSVTLWLPQIDVTVTADEEIWLEVIRGSGTGTLAANTNSNSYVRVVQPTLVASDDFNRASLGSNWTTAGGGNLYISGNELCGVGMPSTPMSYAYWATPVSSDTQLVRAKVRWNGRNPEHSASAVVVRANPALIPAAGASGAQAWNTTIYEGILYEDPDAPNDFRPATGTPDYSSTSKYPENADIAILAVGQYYASFMNSSRRLMGTISTSVIPTSNHTVGLMIQDDSAVSGGGEPPANVDEFRAYVV